MRDLSKNCRHEHVERLSVCCGREELGDESDICAMCRDHTGFEGVCECGAVLPDSRYVKDEPTEVYRADD